ncbi:MAG TPA: hypothetical protein VNO30_47290 [Kofleriaceae bacterium]|nr:hypothetical protein [Kofleriaceae bacterium]
MRSARTLDIVATAAAAMAAVAATTACGRFGFDPSGDAHPSDGSPDGDPTPLALACGETRSAGAATLKGSTLAAVATARGLAALWLDSTGTLRGTTWTTDASGGLHEHAAVELAAGPFSELWAAANGDAILAATQAGGDATGHFLRGDLTKSQPSGALGVGALSGRDPIASRRGGPGFVAIAIAGPKPAIYELTGAEPPPQHLLVELVDHAVPSIAADAGSYAVITEFADQFGAGCWYSKVDDAFGFAGGPGSVESTQQADCDSATVAAAAGPLGAGIAWMDRDPANSYVEFAGTGGGGNVASMSGETDVGLPLVTGTSTGFAVAYRSSAGLRVFDRGGARTLAATAPLVDLVTWSDLALVLWTTATGAPQLTRLCP